MAPKKKLQVPEGPLTADQATALALEAVGAPLIGPHHGRTRKALHAYVARQPQQERAACDAEARDIEQQDAARKARYAELKRLIKEKVQAARREIWELEVEARRLADVNIDTPDGLARLPDTVAMWRNAIAPQVKEGFVPSKYENYPVVYPGGHEGWAKKSYGGPETVEECIKRGLMYDALPLSWLKCDGEVARALGQRRKRLEERRKALALSRAVVFVPGEQRVYLCGHIAKLGPRVLVLDQFSDEDIQFSRAERLDIGSGTYRLEDEALFVRGALRRSPSRSEICAWSTRAVHWLEQNNLVVSLVDDQAEPSAEETS